MSSERHEYEIAKARVEIRRRLYALQRKHRRRFVWINGIVREVTLHPTKGIRSRRWERLPKYVNGAELMGFVGD